MALHAPVNNRLGGAGLAYGLRKTVVFGWCGRFGGGSARQPICFALTSVRAQRGRLRTVEDVAGSLSLSR